MQLFLYESYQVCVWVNDFVHELFLRISGGCSSSDPHNLVVKVYCSTLENYTDTENLVGRKMFDFHSNSVLDSTISKVFLFKYTYIQDNILMYC